MKQSSFPEVSHERGLRLKESRSDQIKNYRIGKKKRNGFLFKKNNWTGSTGWSG
ncbi:hypothetical protein D1AOALGA4SA_13103 [Olavius algarvensis Delta 1 endosymbiont]|nr:hypothetical protein D1AOALGA4SA_13103 [Olavius algarvensis Delta 1 endosymbiont]